MKMFSKMRNGNNRMMFQLALQFRTIVKFGIIVVAAMLFATYMGIKTTEKPVFCSSCKIMKPYYQAWESSTHNDVPCIECHYAPGIKNTVEGKFKALSQVAKYVTQTAGTRPWAEIPDESCLRAECHERRLLEGLTEFGPVTFDHRPHLQEMKRGKQLRCTSCHSQIVMGNHLNVTPSTCYTCHFKDKTFPELWASCLKCHPKPPDVIDMGDGRKFPHGEYIGRNVPCMKCHIEVVKGDGAVPKERCLSCHSEEKHTQKYSDTPLIHKTHVTDHKVECFDCHLEIQHTLDKPPLTSIDDCSTCHLGTHKAELDMYQGTGARHVKPDPGIMAVTQVDCRACHIVNTNGVDSEFTGVTLVTKDVACMACHGVEYKDVLNGWKRTMTVLLAEVEQKSVRARAAGKSWKLKEDDRILAGELLDDAMYNYRFVKNGGGVHNIHYARVILNKTGEMFDVLTNPTPDGLKALVDVSEKTELLPPDVNCTKLCHTSPPQKNIQFFNKTFPHAKHGPDMGIACTQCHSTDKHGETILSADSCNSCHHSDAGAAGCENCHAATIPVSIGRFPHRRHSTDFKQECITCHQHSSSGDMKIARDCASCHHSKARPEDCEKCHPAQAKKISASKMDFSCDLCHQFRDGIMADPTDSCGKCHALHISEETGKHGGKQSCLKCHNSHSWEFKGNGKCLNCHKMTDHAKAKGTDCSGCHTPHTWQPE